ncbi:hypothetical protein ACVW0Y_002798 [Pseudomonas sp. TE3786]
MSGHVGLREDARVGHELARQIAMLFAGRVEPKAKPNDGGVPLRFAALNPTYLRPAAELRASTAAG